MTQKQLFGTRRPTFLDVLLYNIPLLRRLNRKRYDHFRYADWDRDSDKEIGNAGGPAFVCSRRCFEDIGKFDERFFLYMEEFDTAMGLAKK